MSAIRSLLSKIIDYAGLFPPASLPLPETLKTFRHHLAEPVSWILGKIVVPSGALPQINGELLSQFDHFPVTIIATRTVNHGQWLEALRKDLIQAKSFAANRPQVVVESFEVVLPEEIDSAAALVDLLKATSLILEDHPAYFEIPSGPQFDDRFALVGRCLAEFGNRAWGLKLRTGGTRPEQFPAPRTVADAILVSRQAQVPIKFTAGLHHPIRRWDEGLQTEMHGFVNVFLGALLTHVHSLSVDSLIEILEEQDPARFWFRETKSGWNDLELSREMIEKFRQTITSFGSCSVDEPREDLEELGWFALA